jgi:hypothetical protein
VASEKRVVRVLDLITQPHLQAFTARAAPAAQLSSVLADENIIGLGVADKIKGRRRTGELALVFYVKQKRQKVRAGLLVPPKVPSTGGRSIPTDVVQLGPMRLDASPLATKDPIQPGNSIGHVTCLAGTLGAVVKRGGTTLLLSNAHVLADNGNARKGDAILYPARKDKGRTPGDVVAHLDGFVAFQGGGTFVNLADCAVARVTPNGRALIPAIRNLGGPTGITAPKRGMRITKVGRTSGLTSGTVRDVHFRFKLPYPGLGQIGFRDQVLCTPYSASGDSGSLVLEARTKKAVGLHFASSGDGGSVFSPIGPVLRSLGVRLVLGKIAGKGQGKRGRG